jgi:hypothetical protein
VCRPSAGAVCRPFCASAWLLTWHFRRRLAVGVAFIPRARLGLGGAEDVGDALVGGISLPVDAVGVDLQQGRDAVLVTATGQADALVWASS